MPAAVIQQVLDACARDGRLDEQAGVTLWANQLAERGYAGSAIQRQLDEKGFDAHVIARTLQRLQAREPDEERARAVVRAQLRRQAAASRAFDAGRRRQRVARLLAQRGFDSDLIERILVDAFNSSFDA